MCVCRCTLAARSVIAMAMHLKPCRTSSTKASERRRSLKPTTHVRTYRMHHIHSDTRTLPPPPTHTTHLTTQRCLQDIRMSACTSAHQLTFPNCTQISLEQFQETERENAEERNTWYTPWSAPAQAMFQCTHSATPSPPQWLGQHFRAVWHVQRICCCPNCLLHLNAREERSSVIRQSSIQSSPRSMCHGKPSCNLGKRSEKPF